MSTQDIKHMRRALELASRGKGETSPNPCVGAVLLNAEGSVIGEGYHHRAGEPHAEVMAIEDALSRGGRLKGGTIYVSLEPCNHTGRTPPCTQRIIDEEISRVVVACLDPHSEAAGGLERLKEHGITVSSGVEEEKAIELNAGFFCFHRLNRPLVTLKWAMTLDGCISVEDGDSIWITGEEARQTVQNSRFEHDVVLTGIGTLLQDDCRLTVRNVESEALKRKRRVVLDGQLRTPINSQFVQESRITPGRIYTQEGSDKQKKRELENQGVEIVCCPCGEDGRLELSFVLNDLHEEGFLSVYIEGGRRIAGSFVEQRLVDRVNCWIAPKISGGGQKHLGPVRFSNPLGRMGDAIDLERCEMQMIGNDYLLSGWLHSKIFP